MRLTKIGDTVKLLARIFNKLLDITVFLGGALIVFVTISVTYEVAIRNFLDRPPLWVFETTQISLLYLTFLTSGWVLREEAHVRIDLVINRLNPRAGALVNIMTSTLCAIACLVITWYSAWTAGKHFKMGLVEATVLRIPRAVFLIVIPVAFLLLFIQFLRRIRGQLIGWRSLRDEARVTGTDA
jgi:TRAP-type C4-dicarboxylate transport system permease small subunit